MIAQGRDFVHRFVRGILSRTPLISLRELVRLLRGIVGPGPTAPSPRRRPFLRRLLPSRPMLPLLLPMTLLMTLAILTIPRFPQASPFAPPFSTPLFAERRIRVGIYENRPKVFTDSGKPAGIFVDLLEAIAAREGWTLEYVPGTWQEGLDRLSRGDIDIMPDVAYTNERGRLYTFPLEPVLSDWFQVYAPRKNQIRSILDLERKRVSLLRRSVQEDALKNLAKDFELSIATIPFPDYDEAFRAVADGRADAVLTNRFFGEANRSKFGLEDTAVIFHPSRVFFALPKSSDPAIPAALDARLRAFKKDPDSIYYRTLRKWTSEGTPTLIPLWLEVTAGSLLALALLGGAYSLVLRRQVSRRTEELRLSTNAREMAYENWRTTFRAVQDAIWVLDTEGNLLAANPATNQVLNIAPEAALALRWPEIRDKVLGGFDDAPLETVRRKRSRRISMIQMGDRWIRWAVDPVLVDELGRNDGRLKGFILTFSDCTDQKHAEEELAEKEEQIAAINEELQARVEELENTLDQFIQILVNTCELRDPYTAGHQRRVADLARAIAEEMALNPERIRRVELAGLVHDVGKIDIPGEILSKPRRLSDIEYLLVQTHPTAAFRILKAIPASWPLAEIVRQHHERMDGTGYPEKLKGEEILLEARIIAVADTVEAMSSHRPYRPARGLKAALGEILRLRGTGFDPQVVDACVRLFEEKRFTLKEEARDFDD